jgi:hypothetical protein
MEESKPSSLFLLKTLPEERVEALLGELSFDELCGLVLAKAPLAGQRVNINVRPAEARVRPKKQRGPGRGAQRKAE